METRSWSANFSKVRIKTLGIQLRKVPPFQAQSQDCVAANSLGRGAHNQQISSVKFEVLVNAETLTQYWREGLGKKLAR